MTKINIFSSHLFVRFSKKYFLFIFVTVVFIVCFLFSGVIFLSAYFEQFVFNINKVDATLDQLESSNTPFVVSFDPSSPSDIDEQNPYRIDIDSHCNQYNDDWDCIDPVPDLCPYIAITPNNEEDTEIGFTQNPFGDRATGQLSNPTDMTDNWTLSIKSPCFEGECPPDYNEEQNGVPLAQALKGQIFKCDLSVSSNSIPVLVKNYLSKNIAYADNPSNLIEVSAVFTGELSGCTVDCFSNVLFLPGFEGSRLYRKKTILSIPVEDQLWEPNGRADVEDLYLNPDGTSIDPDIYTRDIIQETNVLPIGLLGINIYKSFSNVMNDMVDNFEIADWRQYAYDWRQGVEDIIENGTEYENGIVTLIDTLQGLVNSSKNGKVTIIAHSNGGLVAKAFLKKLQEDKNSGRNNLIDSVDVLILVASPEIGTASAVPAMMHGYDQKLVGGILMTETNARELGRNMTSAYGLLPSKEYINRVSASPVTFVDNAIPSGVTTKLVDTFGSALNSYTEYKNFLLGDEGRVDPIPSQTNFPINLSENLFAKAESLHDNIDAFIPPESLRVIEVAGWGLDTVVSYEYYPNLVDCGLQNYNNKCYTLDERPRFTSGGDKTVVVPSAHYMGFLGNAEKYWLNLKVVNESKTYSNVQNSHKDILEVGSLNNFIQATLKKEEIVFDTVLKNTEPTDDSNRLRLSIHSPVTFDAYDMDGNHTGKICPIDSDFCYVEENISNSSYMEFGEGKYINLPEDQLSKIKLQGTDIGTFTYESEKVLPDGTSTISSFVDIPVTTQTQVEIVLNSITQVPDLKLDVTGDGVMDFTITPKDEFDPILFLQVMKKNVESFNISKQQKSMLLKRIDDTIKAIQKGKINKSKLKIEQFKKALIIHPKENEKDREEREKKNEREHEKEHKENKKPKSLAPTDVQTLIIMLNQLLDNLN